MSATNFHDCCHSVNCEELGLSDFAWFPVSVGLFP